MCHFQNYFGPDLKEPRSVGCGRATVSNHPVDPGRTLPLRRPDWQHRTQLWSEFEKIVLPSTVW
jgi:hypothetical protein